MLTTTLAEIKACSPSKDRWRRLCKGLGITSANKKPLPIERILELTNFADAPWVLRAVKGHDGAIGLFACYCARYALGIFERKYPDDKRPRQAIEAAERFVRGHTAHEELAVAWGTVEASRDAAETASLVASDAAWAAWAAGRAAFDAAAAGAAKAAEKATRAVAWAADRPEWITAYVVVSKDFEHEFRLLCRLEGEYAAFRKIE